MALTPGRVGLTALRGLLSQSARRAVAPCTEKKPFFKEACSDDSIHDGMRGGSALRPIQRAGSDLRRWSR